mmetsp:Transcript_10776/g.25822  ORF Transcript_10776/g.25822 Transcript_10776/m.25822 type:complete len:454 (+) Transcript_10776:94-1455(+)
MPVSREATEYTFRLLIFSICWLAVSTAAFMDVFVFAKSRHDMKTATEEFNLEPSQRAAIYSAFYLGWLLGDPFFGWIADLWGRHPAVYSSTLLGFIFSMMGSMAVGPYSLFTVRLVAGICMGGADLVGFVYIMELSKMEQRATTASVMQGFFAMGVCLASAIAVVFPSWRQMYLVSSLPAVIFMASYFWIPESPKWLAQQLRTGKMKGSERVTNSNAEKAEEHRRLLNVAGGGGEAGAAEKGEAKEGDSEEFTYMEILQDSNVSRNLLLMCGVWLQGGFTYYGITLSAGNISKEIHLNMFLMGIVEIPAYIMCAWLADTIGRRWALISTTIGMSVFCLISWVWDTKEGRLLFALIGKIFASAVFGIIWMWSPEIFPTGARSLTTAIGSQAARVGSILAPYVVVLMEEANEAAGATAGAELKRPPLPQPVFAISALLGISCAFFLPETYDKELV